MKKSEMVHHQKAPTHEQRQAMRKTQELIETARQRLIDQYIEFRMQGRASELVDFVGLDNLVQISRAFQHEGIRGEGRNLQRDLERFRARGFGG